MWPQFRRRSVDRTVVGTEKETAWQAGVDGPCGYVTARIRLVDERRSDVDIGIVGPRVVFRDVFERTGWLVVDGDVDGGGRGTARVVRPNRVGYGRRLHDRRNAPNRSVARSEVEAGRQGGVDGPRGDGPRTGQRRIER